jgi:hypothetical protein
MLYTTSITHRIIRQQYLTIRRPGLQDAVSRHIIYYLQNIIRSDKHLSPAGTVVQLPNPSYRHATTGDRHQQLLHRLYVLSQPFTTKRYPLPTTAGDWPITPRALASAEEEGADIYSTTGSDERELRLPLSVLLPTQRLAGSGELSFSLGLGRVDGEETAYSFRKRLHMLGQKSTSAPPSWDRSARSFSSCCGVGLCWSMRAASSRLPASATSASSTLTKLADPS